MSISQGEQPNSNEAHFEEDAVYRAQVEEISIESSKKYPGTVYPRIKFSVYDTQGRRKPMSWIPWEMDEITPAITAIDPDAPSKPIKALVGEECCVRVSLRRGVVVREILGKTALSTPTLAEQQAAMERIVQLAPKAE